MTLDIDRIYQGDCLDLIRQIPDGSIDAIVTDPPYSSGGLFRGDRAQTTGTKYVSEHEYPDFPGDGRDQRSFYTWCVSWMSQCWRVAKQGSLFACFSDWRQLPTVTDAFQGAGWIWRGVYVWDKTESVRPQLGQFRNQCEYVVWGTKGAHDPCIRAVVPGVFRGRTVQPARRIHQTEKPVALLENLLQIVPEGGTVLDPFAVSGTTAIACLRTGRHFLGCELHPGYFEMAGRRIDEERAQRPLFPAAYPAGGAHS